MSPVLVTRHLLQELVDQISEGGFEAIQAGILLTCSKAVIGLDHSADCRIHATTHNLGSEGALSRGEEAIVVVVTHGLDGGVVDEVTRQDLPYAFSA